MTCWRCGAEAAEPGDRDDLPPTPPRLSSLSAVHHLLQSNCPPAEAEIPVLADIIVNAQRGMDALEARIENLRAALDQLISQRDDSARLIRGCTSALSPIRRLPPEIVHEIFSWTSRRTRRVAGHAPTGAPWYLGQISGIWREIALGLPSFWNTVTVLHNNQFPCQQRSALPMIQAQLVRSARAPLHVDFEWMKKDDDASALLEALLPSSDRWISLRLICCDSVALLELLHSAKGRLSQLEALEIDDEGCGEIESSTASDVFSIAPNLRQVLLTNVTFNRFSPTLLIPCQQLTQYRGVHTVKRLVDIFQAASGLVDAALGFVESDPEIPEGTVIPLPHLRRLFTEQQEILACLVAPQLESLSCDPVHVTVSFIQRSACRLTTLVMTDATYTLKSEVVILLLQHTPSLKNLVLRGHAMDQSNNKRVLTALTLTGYSGDLCPDLTFLAYGAANGTLSSDVFVAMVHSRRQPDRDCQLFSLRLFSRTKGSADHGVLAGLQLLIDGGLDVRFLHSPSQFVKQATYSFDIFDSGS
ncbi:hypothetical protein C8R47DRAFT_1323535 [Mycena vitilis]|nr:hypothetical protein C8R47DRAFT_1323535 [Mycena vitilis]